MRTLAILMLMLAAPVFADTGVELPKNTPIPIIVEDLNPAAKALGLTEDFVRSKVELQFRRNGLVPEAESKKYKPYYAYIRISVVGGAWSWDVSFARSVKYIVDGKTFSTIAKTYSSSATGTHGQDEKYILESLMDGVDILSNEILKSAQ